MPDIPELVRILHSGQLAAGKYTHEFEEKLTQYFYTDSILTTGTFETAISVAITSCGLDYGDEIIASPMACLGSTQPYVTAGLKTVWADIDPRTGTLDPDSVREKITEKTKAIIHNHFCGYPGYIDEINSLGREYGIIVIDDGIECFGTEYKGKRIGSCGTDVTVFSFNPVRVLSTIDGGAVIFKDMDYYQKGLLVRDCGIDRGIFRDSIGEISPLCDIKLKGYGGTLSNPNAYIGSCQINTVDERIQKQRMNASEWDSIIETLDFCKSLKTPYGRPNYWVYGLLAKEKRECIMRFRNAGYYASGVHINNNIYTIFGKQKTLPGVQEFYDSFVAIPCGWWIDNIDFPEKQSMG